MTTPAADPTTPIARCATCRYDLRGLPTDAKCPECGGIERLVDPNLVPPTRVNCTGATCLTLTAAIVLLTPLWRKQYGGVPLRFFWLCIPHIVATIGIVLLASRSAWTQAATQPGGDMLRRWGRLFAQGSLVYVGAISALGIARVGWQWPHPLVAWVPTMMAFAATFCVFAGLRDHMLRDGHVILAWCCRIMSVQLVAGTVIVVAMIYASSPSLEATLQAEILDPVPVVGHSLYSEAFWRPWFEEPVRQFKAYLNHHERARWLWLPITTAPSCTFIVMASVTWRMLASRRADTRRRRSRVATLS